ncbi:MAG: GspMb/PilO family protein [Candidatus Omnitrophota bacterium]
MKAKLSKTERILFITAGISLSILVLYYFVIAPLSKKTSMLNSRILLSEKKLKKFLRVLNNKDKISKEYDIYAPYLDVSSSNEEIQAKMLEEIEYLAKTSGLYIIDMKPQPVKKIAAYRKYIVAVQAEGELEALVTFLHRLYKVKSLLDVEQMNSYTRSIKDGLIFKHDFATTKVVF